MVRIRPFIFATFVFFVLFVGRLSLPAQIVTKAPAARPAATAPVEKNLVSVSGVHLSKTAKTEEEEEEQAGMVHSSSIESNFSAVGESSINATGTPESILKYVAGGKELVCREAKLPDVQIHVVIKAASRETVLEKLAAAYEQAFKVKIKIETREVDAFKLQADRRVLTTLPRPTGEYSEKTNFDIRDVLDGKDPARSATIEGTLNSLASFLQRQLKMPVIDDSHLIAEYHFEFNWTSDSPVETMKKSLAKQGITLAPTKVKQTAIYVEKLAASSQSAPAASPAKK